MKKILTSITVLSFLLISQFVNASQKELDEITGAIQAQGAKWVADETSMSKLTPAERKLRCGLLEEASVENLSLQPLLAFPYAGAAPSSFDWRNAPNGNNYVTTVKDQGNCGSCWAFSTTAALESNVFILQGLNTNEAEQILVSCSNAGSCSGGYISSASQFIQTTGLPAESYDTYAAKNIPCKKAVSGWQNYTKKISGWNSTSYATVDFIKSWIYNYGPVVATMYVYNDFMYYGGGVYSYTTGNYLGLHAILVVGYNDNGGNGYFIVKNSWGTNWGESGYFRIAYSQLSNLVHFASQTIMYSH